MSVFDVLVMPILMHGVEAWGFHSASDADALT